MQQRWVNSGTVLGTLKDQKLVFDKLEKLLETRVEEADQAYFNTLHYRGDLTIDYFSRLFLSTTAGDEKLTRVRHPIEGINDTAIPFPLSPSVSIIRIRVRSPSWYTSPTLSAKITWISGTASRGGRQRCATSLRLYSQGWMLASYALGTIGTLRRRMPRCVRKNC